MLGMSNQIQRKIRHIFENMLSWDLVKKSQAVLIYATIMKAGLYVLLTVYQAHPLLDSAVVNNVRYLIIIFTGINALLFAAGFYFKKNKNQHYYYALSIMLYYGATLLIVPILVGLLNVVNGLIIIVTTLICMVFFPKKIGFLVQILFALGYGVIIGLMTLKYIDYGLLFQPHVLMHPLLLEEYLIYSALYAASYIIVALALFSLCIDAWHEKLYGHDSAETYRDIETGLLNRCGVHQVASLQLKQAYLVHAELSLVVLDIDNFKRVLEQYGQEYESAILKHVAEVLRANLRASDMIARYDLEQFVLVLAFTPLERAEDVAEMCRKTLEQSILQLDEGRHIFVKASFGVSSTVHNEFEFLSLVTSAQQALQMAKVNGKNQVCSSGMVRNS